MQALSVVMNVLSPSLEVFKDAGDDEDFHWDNFFSFHNE